MNKVTTVTKPMIIEANQIYFIECERDGDFGNLRAEVTAFIFKNYGGENGVDFADMKLSAVAMQILEALELNYCNITDSNNDGVKVSKLTGCAAKKSLKQTSQQY